jgi:hypothetical protein
MEGQALATEEGGMMQGGGITEGDGAMEEGDTTNWYDKNAVRRDVACYSHCSSLVGLVTPPDVGLSSFVGLSTHLPCHSS